MNGREYQLAGDSAVEVQKIKLPACLTKSFEFERINHKKSSLSCNGENPVRTNESVSSEKLTGDNSLKYLLTHTNRQLSERIPD